MPVLAKVAPLGADAEDWPLGADAEDWPLGADAQAKKPEADAEDLESEQPDSPASRARRLLGLDPSPEPEASVGDGKGVLVRGHSDLRGAISGKAEDRDAVLGRLCTEALPGWAGVDPSRCKVQDVSGKGGSQTYKISAHGRGVEPRTVALHSRSGAASGGAARDPLNDVITEAAAVVFAKAGLSPPRLAYGKDWFLELWEGTGWPDHDAEELPAQLGKQLAAVHAIPTEWFDGWREKLKESFPFLKPVPDGSQVWWFAHRSQDFLANRSNEWKELCESIAAAPLPAARPLRPERCSQTAPPRRCTSRAQLPAGGLSPYTAMCTAKTSCGSPSPESTTWTWPCHPPTRAVSRPRGRSR